MSILADKFALDALRLALEAGIGMAEDQHHDASMDPDIDEQVYVEYIGVYERLLELIERFAGKNDAWWTIEGFVEFVQAWEAKR